ETAEDRTPPATQRGEDELHGAEQQERSGLGNRRRRIPSERVHLGNVDRGDYAFRAGGKAGVERITRWPAGHPVRGVGGIVERVHTRGPAVDRQAAFDGAWVEGTGGARLVFGDREARGEVRTTQTVC